MNVAEIKALVFLLDDEDVEVVSLVETKIRSLGGEVIPFLEDRWEDSSLSPMMQRKIEDIIHDLQYEAFMQRLMHWYQTGCADLLEGLWAVATYQYPELSIEKLRTELDQMYFDVWQEFRDNMHPMDEVKTLNAIFFQKFKFGANTKHFHAASNSMINVVLDTKKGNPISLCAIYMLIAQKIGMPVYGVNLPSLFIVTYKSERLQFYINVFNKGIVFSKSDIDNYLAQLNLEPNDSFYEPCSNIDIIRRVLRNLILSFEKVGDKDKVKELEEALKLLLS